MSERYPLSWPEGWKRTANRRCGRFGKQATYYSEEHQARMSAGTKSLTVHDAVKRILSELSRMGVSEGDAIISTNIPVRLDGLPYSNASEPKDPGAAVYWKLKGHSQCMAIDLYDRAADNLAAIAATISALRAIERHGGATILERAFRGFAALPEKAGGKSWRQILNFPELTVPSEQMVKDHFRELATTYHPDKEGGSRLAFEELIWAREAALQEIR
jgi:hypothetical protein